MLTYLYYTIVSSAHGERFWVIMTISESAAVISSRALALSLFLNASRAISIRSCIGLICSVMFCAAWFCPPVCVWLVVFCAKAFTKRRFANSPDDAIEAKTAAN